MIIDHKIRDEKLQYDINKEAAKTSALSSGKIDKYEYLTDEEILPSNQGQVIEQAEFTYSLLGKALEKQRKNDWTTRRKTNKNNWRSRREANKGTWKQSRKTFFRDRTKINNFFVFKRLSKWRSSIWFEQNYRNQK